MRIPMLILNLLIIYYKSFYKLTELITMYDHYLRYYLAFNHVKVYGCIEFILNKLTFYNYNRIYIFFIFIILIKMIFILIPFIIQKFCTKKGKKYLFSELLLEYSKNLLLILL